MSKFNYIEYLRKSKKMQTLNENFSIDELEEISGPTHSDGTPKSNDEMTDDELNDFYDNLDSVDENTSYIREKVREALSEDDGEEISEDLEASLMKDLDEDCSYDPNEYSEKLNEAEDEDEEDVELEDEADEELEADVSNMGGDSKELTTILMQALETAKSMGNEKLTTQVMNTLKFAIDQSMVD